jgi:hypothetical protein
LREDAVRMEALKRQLTVQEQQVADLKTAFDERGDNTSRLKESLTIQDQEIEDLRRQLSQRAQHTPVNMTARRQDMLAILGSPRAKLFTLSGTANAPSAGGWLLVDPERQKALLYAFGLPALPQGMTYQLWALADKPLSGGTFSVDQGHKTRQLIKTSPEWNQISRFAVSLEPEGGRAQLSGETYLSASP